jgi:hypothetical protein
MERRGDAAAALIRMSEGTRANARVPSPFIPLDPFDPFDPVDPCAPQYSK